jgi:hypothetical protein
MAIQPRTTKQEKYEHPEFFFFRTTVALLLLFLYILVFMGTVCTGELYIKKQTLKSKEYLKLPIQLFSKL